MKRTKKILPRRMEACLSHRSLLSFPIQQEYQLRSSFFWGHWMGFGHLPQRMTLKKEGKTGQREEDDKGRKSKKARLKEDERHDVSGLCFGLPIDSWLP